MGSSSLTAQRDAQLAEGRARRDVEGERVGVHFVILAIGQLGGKVDHRGSRPEGRFLLRLQALSTEGMNSFGIAPPTTSFSNTKPEPGGQRFESIVTSANWPEPPVCFLWVYLTVTGLESVSR